jgi:hypothetical protein
VLAELEARLPVIRTQAMKIQLMYDSGRQKVRVALFSHFSILTGSSVSYPRYRPKRSRRTSDG